MAGEILRSFSFCTHPELPARVFLDGDCSVFMTSVGPKVFHCGTEFGFDRRRGRKKLSSMASIHSSHSVDSATDDILLTNIFWAADAAQADLEANFSGREWKNNRSVRIRRSGSFAGFAELFRIHGRFVRTRTIGPPSGAFTTC